MRARILYACLLRVLTLVFWVDVAQAHAIALFWIGGQPVQTVETATRLRGECLALGIHVASFRESGELDRPNLALLDPGPAAVDAIMVVSASGAEVLVTIWLLNEARQPFVWVTLVAPLAADNAPEKVSIRAAETLHSRLLEPDFAKRSALPPNSEPRYSLSESVSSQPAARSELRMGVSVGGALLVGTKGLSAAFLPSLRLEWSVLPWLVLQTTVAGLGSESRAAAEQGQARVAQHYAVVGGMYQGHSAFLRPFVGVSGGVMLSSIDGRANAPLRAHDSLRLVGLAEISAGSELDLTSRWYLTMAGHVHFALPAVAIYVVDELVAVSGTPNWVVSAAVGVRL